MKTLVNLLIGVGIVIVVMIGVHSRAILDIVFRWAEKQRIGADVVAREDAVVVGDVWYRADGPYVVWRKIDSSEAGSDSWVMKRVRWAFDVWELTGDGTYMHHADRMRGDWIRIRPADRPILRAGSGE
jgi:hypothetical protein